MGAVSRATLRLVGSHAGLSIRRGRTVADGAGGSGDMRAVHGSAVLYPADGNARAAWSQRWWIVRGHSMTPPRWDRLSSWTI
jgi:hypothetical protein